MSHLDKKTSKVHNLINKRTEDIHEFIMLVPGDALDMADAQERFFRPFLSMAIFCERVLREADGVISAIRIIDRYNIPGTTTEMPTTTVRFSLIVGFKAGDIMRGPAALKIVPSDPNGERLPSYEFTLHFEGDNDRGVSLVAEMDFNLVVQGVYWFDILLEDDLITRMPLKVVYLRQPRAESSV